MVKCSALLALPYLLREDAVKLFDKRNKNQPTILCRGAEIKPDDINLLAVLNSDSVTVMVKDCHIAFTPDLTHVFGIMTALHYVFSLSFAAPKPPLKC